MEGNRGSGIREIEEEERDEEKVFVAVAKELKEGRRTLLWVIQNTSREKKRIVITHVHRPSQMIPFMGGKFPANKINQNVVKEYRQHEREKMLRSLDDYMTLCSELKVRAEKLVVEADDVGKGLIELIAHYGITKLVMGAAADKHYSRRLKVPKTRTSIAVNQQADPSCKIWFVCKGNLICTREATLDGCRITPSPSSSQSSTSSQSEQLRSRSLPGGQAEPLSWAANPIQVLSTHRSRSDNFDSRGGGIIVSPALPITASIPRTRFSTEGSLTPDPWEGISRRTSLSSAMSPLARSDSLSLSGSSPMPRDNESEEGSVLLPLVHESDEDQRFSSPQNELEDTGFDAEVYNKLQEALAEAHNLKQEAYKEALKRQKSEMNAIEALRRAKVSENLYAKEVNQRKEIEEALEREKLEVQFLRNQRDEIFEQFQEANKQKLALELCISDSDGIVKDLEEKLSAAQHLLSTLQMEHEELLLQQDAAVTETAQLRQRQEQATTSSHRSATFSEFSYLEIEQATDCFSNSLKIGEGGYGSVYKGFIRNTRVAIKMLNPQSMQGQSEFHQEVNVLSRMRHPNLVTLIGACVEAWALIYEFLPSGSLEDRLECKNNTPPLPWQVRTHIATEICSALIFLHSNRPCPLVHGDLKPANILLDANLVSKLGDFGICRLLVQSTISATLYHLTEPKGTLAYMDPEFLSSGELTACSDVYSFGVVILRLLTGRPPFGIVKDVKEAMEEGLFHGIMDPTAGDWPFVQAKQLAHLGLRCCEMSRKSRPDLVGEAWRVLEPMLKAASLPLSPSSFQSITDDNSHTPNYFICPIFQEIMQDPHIAADGFTYEAEALKGWIDSGHKTSPMTNLPLPHCDLIPNRALRSAIQEWLQQHRQS